MRKVLRKQYRFYKRVLVFLIALALLFPALHYSVKDAYAADTIMHFELNDLGGESGLTVTDSDGALTINSDEGYATRTVSADTATFSYTFPTTGGYDTSDILFAAWEGMSATGDPDGSFYTCGETYSGFASDSGELYFMAMLAAPETEMDGQVQLTYSEAEGSFPDGAPSYGTTVSVDGYTVIGNALYDRVTFHTPVALTPTDSSQGFAGWSFQGLPTGVAGVTYTYYGDSSSLTALSEGTILPADTDVMLWCPDQVFADVQEEIVAEFQAEYATLQTASVTFEDENGRTYSQFPAQNFTQSADMESSFTVTMPSDSPSKTGYTFAGWKCDLDGTVYQAGTKAVLYYGSELNTAVTFTAQWKTESLKNITVKYSDGSVFYSKVPFNPYTITQNSPDEEKAVLEVPVSSPAKVGYFFKYWKYGSAFYEPGDAFEVSYAGVTSVTLTAQWQKAKTATVVIDANGGSVSGSGTFTYTQSTVNDDTYTARIPDGTPERSGYFFTGWSYGNMVYAPGATLTLQYDKVSGATVTAQWQKAKQIAVGYNANGGSYSGSGITYTQGTIDDSTVTYTIGKQSPTRDRAFFDGWYCSEDGNVYQPGKSLTFSYGSTDTNNVTFTAQWTMAKVTGISFGLDGGSFGTSDYDIVQSSRTESEYSFSIPEEKPTRNDYYFYGWRNSRDDQVYQPGADFKYAYSDGSSVKFSAVWVQLIGEGTYDISGDTRYRFREGSWSVEGDSTVYSGDQYFFTSDGNEMKFTQQ